MSLYDLEVKDVNGNNVSMESYKGKVLLIVNTATGCGFTPQYEGLQKLYDQYKEQGFEVLDFPCNQFGNQAPGSNEEIHQFCQLKYHTTFPLFEKVEVNGENESPVFSFLKKEKKSLIGAKINWNFTKFLVNQEGKVVGRFEPTTEPSKISKKIEALLSK